MHQEARAAPRPARVQWRRRIHNAMEQGGSPAVTMQMWAVGTPSPGADVGTAYAQSRRCGRGGPNERKAFNCHATLQHGASASTMYVASASHDRRAIARTSSAAFSAASSAAFLAAWDITTQHTALTRVCLCQVVPRTAGTGGAAYTGPHTLAVTRAGWAVQVVRGNGSPGPVHIRAGVSPFRVQIRESPGPSEPSPIRNRKPDGLYVPNRGGRR